MRAKSGCRRNPIASKVLPQAKSYRKQSPVPSKILSQAKSYRRQNCIVIAGTEQNLHLYRLSRNGEPTKTSCNIRPLDIADQFNWC